MSKEKDIVLGQKIVLGMQILIVINVIICILNIILWDSDFIRGMVLGMDLPIIVVYFILIRHNNKELKKLKKEIEQWEKMNK